jgi:hypothetical protein
MDMRISMKVLLVILAMGAVAALWSCTSGATCGEGTIEQNGECVADTPPPGGSCGAGSKFNPVTGQCEISFCPEGGNCGICGPNTQLQHDDAGVPYCAGTGGGLLPCDQEIACPDPGAGKMMICGRILDLKNSEFMTNVTGSDPSTILKVGFYDALGFAGGASTPQFRVSPDVCGRYVSADASHPGVDTASLSAPFVAVGVDDASGNLGQGTFALVGIAMPAAAGNKIAGVRTYAIANADANWQCGTSSCLSQGIYMPIFIDTNGIDTGHYPGAPKAGVTIIADTATDPASDYYFSDTNPLTRTALGSGSSTGANGTGIFVGGPTQDYGGTNPVGCTWMKNLGGTIPNVVFVQEKLTGCQ